MHLGYGQIERFNRYADQFLQVDVGRSNYAERSYRFLKSLVPNEFIAFGTLHLREKSLEIGADRPMPRFTEAMEGLGSVMSESPLFNWNPTTNRGKPFTTSDFYTKRQFRETAPYCLTLRVLGVDNHCAVHVPSTSGEISFFGIERKGGPDFSQEERMMLSLAQPLLGCARRLAVERENLVAKQANAAALMRAGLTLREADVLTLVARGDSNQEIASELRICTDTVKEHISNVFQKTGMGNRFAAALWALKTTERDLTRATLNHLPRIVVPAKVD